MAEIEFKRVWVRKHPMPEVDEATMQAVREALSERLDAMMWDTFASQPLSTDDPLIIDVQPISVSPPLEPPDRWRQPLPLLDVARDAAKVVRSHA